MPRGTVNGHLPSCQVRADTSWLLPDMPPFDELPDVPVEPVAAHPQIMAATSTAQATTTSVVRPDHGDEPMAPGTSVRGMAQNAAMPTLICT